MFCLYMVIQVSLIGGFVQTVLTSRFSFTRSPCVQQRGQCAFIVIFVQMAVSLFSFIGVENILDYIIMALCTFFSLHKSLRGVETVFS